MLEIKDASLKLGGKQLYTGLCLSVDKGEILCLSGNSGGGKTSLLRVMMGFQPLDDGFASIDGVAITPGSAEMFRKMMSYMPQDTTLPYEEVKDMVTMPFRLKVNKDVRFSKKLLMSEWDRLGLEHDLYDKKVAELSGGQRQRIMLSVAGLLGKEILLIDEPTSALDENSSAQVAVYLRRLASDGAIVIVVSHDRTIMDASNTVVEI